MALKFRVWHEEWQDYYKVDTIDLTNGFVHFSNEYNRGVTYIENVSVEQSTGELDKNEIEIYVGDIVKITFVFGIVEVTAVNSIWEFAQWAWDNVSEVTIIGNIHQNKELSYENKD